MPRIKVGDKDIYYLMGERVPGEGDKAGPLILFLHGAAGTYRKWRHQVDALGGRYCTMAIDLPGHGQSDGEANGAEPVITTIAGYARFIGDLWEAVRHEWPGVPGLVVVGHSMGAAVAMEFALTRPRGLIGLVLAGAGARMRVHPDFLAALRQGAYPLEMVASAYGPYAPAGLLDQERKDIALVPPEVRYWDFLACDAFDRLHDVGQIRVPALLLTGDRDRLTPPKFARYLNEQIPGSRLILIEGAGHMAMLEDPGRVSRAIGRFLGHLIGESYEEETSRVIRSVEGEA